MIIESYMRQPRIPEYCQGCSGVNGKGGLALKETEIQGSLWSVKDVRDIQYGTSSENRRAIRWSCEGLNALHTQHPKERKMA